MARYTLAGMGALALVVAVSWPVSAVSPGKSLSGSNSEGKVEASGESQTFIRAGGTRLYEGRRRYEFRGFNLYNINGRGNCGYEIPDLDSELDEIGPAANVVRGWFFQRLATNPSTGQLDWGVFDGTLATLRQHGMRVIVTLADEWGACDGDQARERLTLDWYAGGYRTAPYSSGAPLSYRDWVTAIVTRYRDDPTILAWQLMNEAEAPMDVTGTCDEQAAATALQDWASDIAGLIKGIDRNHLVSIGTIGGGQCGMRGPDYRALHAIAEVDLCEHHDYRDWQLVPDDLRYDLEVCRALDKPTFVGEIGLTGATFGGDVAARASALNRKLTGARGAGVVGSLVWAWRSDGDGGSSATSFDVGPSDPLLRFLSVIPEHPRVPPRAVRL
jgi:mannan endo-1,4-beta-mannosidase